VAQQVASDSGLDNVAVGRAGVAGALAAAGSRRRVGKRNQPLAYLFLLPALAVLVLFHFFPIFYAFYISLHNWRIRRVGFIGLENYRQALQTEEFWRAFGNTVFYVLGTVPLTLALALLFAYLLFQKVRFLAFFRTAYFLPYITSTVAAAAIWGWIFRTDTGVLNQITGGLFGVRLRWLQEPTGVFLMLGRALGFAEALPGWLHGPSLALVAVMVTSIWHYVGFDIVIFLAGLGNINRELYEAARIDGAGEWDLFRRITLPLLLPTVFFLTIISTIGAFQTFNQIYVMTGGGPINSSETVVIYMVNQFYSSTRFGYGSAVAFILFLFIFALTLIQLRLGRRREAV
jgi:multiple sugar transport system permease protein